MGTNGLGSARRYALACVLAVGCLLLPGRRAGGDDIAAQGRQAVDKWKDAVIAVRLVLKMTMEGESEESKQDAVGTVIDPSGLTVMSLMEVDPAEAYRRAGGGRKPEEASSYETQVTDVKLRLNTGKEVPAKVVLRDADLDLAFLRPVEKLAEPIPAVDLTQSAAPQLLDQVLTINRLGNAADWVIAPRLDRIKAILAKPRLMYAPVDGDRLGTPAFSLDGKIVGISVVRIPSATSGGESDNAGAMLVIMPAADVLAVAKQAAE